MTHVALLRTIKNKNGMTTVQVAPANTGMEPMYISSERIELELTIRGYLTTESWHEVNDWLLRNLVPRDASIKILSGVNTVINVSWFTKKPDDSEYVGTKEFMTGKKIIKDAQKPKEGDINYGKYKGQY